ncbi:MAG: 6-phosphogluconolactonase [Chitinophagales bacterium]
MIRIYNDLTLLSRAAAQLICDASEMNIGLKGEFSIVLSGGETPRVVYELLASAEYRFKIDWKHVIIFFGDERYVPPSDNRSNFKMAFDTLLKHVPVAHRNVFPIPTDSTPEENSDGYEEILKEKFSGLFPEFDLVLLGLGTDGHTASLFPYTGILNEKKKWVSAVFVDQQKEFRITLTASAINSAKQVVFLVAGKSKAEILRQVLEGKKNTQLLPAQLITPCHGGPIWMVDRASAEYLLI